jgi:tetratricopeptide (TPR) repeat protein
MESPRLQLLLGLLTDQPKDSFVLFALAKEYEKLGQNESALVFYERLQAADPDYVGLYYHLGKLHERAERIDAAVTVYQSGMLVAKKVGDQHAFAELAGAKMQWTDDE